MNGQAFLADITFTENDYVDVAQLNALYRLMEWDRHNRRTEAETTIMLSVSHYYIAAHAAEGTLVDSRAFVATRMWSKCWMSSRTLRIAIAGLRPSVCVGSSRTCNGPGMLGFNRSLQHILIGGVDGDEEVEVGPVGAREAALARSAAGIASSGAMAPLEGDRSGVLR